MIHALTMIDDLQCDNRHIRADVRRAELFGRFLDHLANPRPAAGDGSTGHNSKGVVAAAAPEGGEL